MQPIRLQQLNGLGEVFNDLASIYTNSIPLEPVIGVLQINAHLQDIPPINRINVSPVGAQISEISFKTWADPVSYLNKHKSVSIKLLEKRLPDSFYEKTLQLCQNPQLLLALTTLLFLDGQIRTLSQSPSPAQDVFLKLISPIVRYKSAPTDEIKPSKLTPNAMIKVVLCAGKVPMALTYHDEKTLRNWLNELEAATVLLLPQVVLFTESSLPESSRTFFLDLLEDEFEAWSKRKPRLGEAPSWDWLPKLL